MDSKLPKLRQDLVVNRQEQRGDIVYYIKDPITDRFFRLREPEYFLAKSLDGISDIEEILERFKKRFQIEISEEQYRKFIGMLEQKYFLESAVSEYTVSRKSESGGKRSFIDRILYVKLKAFNPSGFLEWLYKRFRFTLSLPFIVISGLIIIAGLMQAWSLADRMPYNIYQVFGLSSIPVILIAIFAVVALHELAHSVVCRHYGGKVNEMGFLLLYFQVCFYCNLSDSYMFDKKYKKILTILAGMYFQAFLGAVTLLLWRILKTGTIISDLLFLTASISLLTLLFNLNPLLKLDGYYLLTDLVDIPNLRSKAFNYLKRGLHRMFVGPVDDLIPVDSREKRIYLIYAILAIVYSVILFSFLGSILYKLLVGKWAGAGFLLFLAIIVVIFNEPIRKAFGVFGKIFKGQGMSVPKSIRFYIWMAVLLAVVLLAFLVPVNLKINAPLTIGPLEKFTIKGGNNSQLETNWFTGGLAQKPINRVYLFSISDFAVLDIQPALKLGTVVDSGDILLEISSNHFVSQLEQTEAEIDKAKAEYELLLSDPKTAELAGAKAALDEALLQQIQVENDYQRARTMHERKLISEEEWETFKTGRNIQNRKVQKVQADFDLLKEGPKAEELLKQDAEIKRLESKADYLRDQIASCTIYAPFAGTLTMMGEQDELVSLTRTDSIEVIIRVPEDQIDILGIDQKVKFRVAGYPRTEFVGKIDKIIASSQIFEGSNYFTAIAVVENSDNRLKSGMHGFAKIFCGKSSIAENLWRKFVRFFRVEFWSWW